MPKVSGTPRKLTLNGLPFDFAFDTNITENAGQITEGISTSGRTMYKVTKNIPTREAVTIVADDTDFSSLKNIAEEVEPFPMSYTVASGSVYRNRGLINIENRETEENRVTIMLIPDGEWSEFIAS